MVAHSENRHYTAIKNISRLLKSLNSKNHQGTYHCCINFLNVFRKESARDKHYEYCRDKGNVKIKIPSKDEKWLKYHDGQYQFKVPFVMYAAFESILIPVKERYEDRMKELKNKRKDTESNTKKVNRHLLSGWCVRSKFAYGDIQDPLKAYIGKDCVEKFVEHIEGCTLHFHNRK